MLRLHDTATGTVRPLELRTEGEVSMYVCGPTVYDMPHIGHGRANLTFDILRRYLSFIGLKVHHVANVTDVDDNIIKRAAALGAPSPTWRPNSRPAGGSRWTRWVTCARRTSRTPRSTSRTWWPWWPT